MGTLDDEVLGVTFGDGCGSSLLSSLAFKSSVLFFPNPGLISPLLLGSLDGSWVGEGDETGGEGDGDGDDDFGCSLSAAAS